MTSYSELNPMVWIAINAAILLVLVAVRFGPLGRRSRDREDAVREPPFCDPSVSKLEEANAVGRE